MQGQLWVADREWCDLTSYDPRFPDGLQLAIARIHRDERAIKELREACEKAEAEVCAIVEELRQMKEAA